MVHGLESPVHSPAKGALLIALLVVGGPAVSQLDAQSAQEPAFEVAAIRPNRSGAPNIGGPGDTFSNGQFRTTNIPLRVLLRQAFERFQDDEIVGGPAWLDTDRWDIVAKAESPTAAVLPMIRTLLAERFKLTTHNETRNRPIYALVRARADGRLGSSLRQATGPRSFRGSTGIITARNVSISLLATLLGSAVQRPVVDRSGLSGAFDVDLRWMPDVVRPDAAPSDFPDIFTAIQEQLGLKLEPSNGPVDVLVIDRIERPTEN